MFILGWPCLPPEVSCFDSKDIIMGPLVVATRWNKWENDQMVFHLIAWCEEK